MEQAICLRPPKVSPDPLRYLMLLTIVCPNTPSCHTGPLTLRRSSKSSPLQPLCRARSWRPEASSLHAQGLQVNGTLLRCDFTPSKCPEGLRNVLHGDCKLPGGGVCVISRSEVPRDHTPLPKASSLRAKGLQADQVLEAKSSRSLRNCGEETDLPQGESDAAGWERGSNCGDLGGGNRQLRCLCSHS